MEKRQTKTKEERCIIIDEKIAKHKDAIQKLEEKKFNIMHSVSRRTKNLQLKELISQIESSGLTIEDIKEKVGIK